MSSAAEQLLVHCAELVSMRPSTMKSNIANEERIRTEPCQPRVIPRFNCAKITIICEAQRQGFSDKTGGARSREFRLGGAKRKVPRDRREWRPGSSRTFRLQRTQAADLRLKIQK